MQLECILMPYKLRIQSCEAASEQLAQLALVVSCDAGMHLHACLLTKDLKIFNHSALFLVRSLPLTQG